LVIDSPTDAIFRLN